MYFVEEIFSKLEVNKWKIERAWHIGSQVKWLTIFHPVIWPRISRLYRIKV